MRVSLRYRRLPRPRGGWLYGLWAAFSVDYTAEERDSLAPDWDTADRPRGGTGVPIAIAEEPRASGRRSAGTDPHPDARLIAGTTYGWRHLACRHDTTWTAEMFFPSPDGRESFVAALHVLRDAALTAAKKFWHDNPPVPGDASEVDASVSFSPDEQGRLPRRKMEVMTA